MGHSMALLQRRSTGAAGYTTGSSAGTGSTRGGRAPGLRLRVARARWQPVRSRSPLAAQHDINATEWHWQAAITLATTKVKRAANFEFF